MPAGRLVVPLCSVDAMPRRICDRITPLLPRAPISDPWLMASHVASSPARAPVHLGDDGVERAGHVGAGVAVGHRVDVEPVDGSGVGPHASRNVVTVCAEGGDVENRSNVALERRHRGTLRRLGPSRVVKRPMRVG